MTNRTQCPNCLTNYYISDQQFRRCRGKVRCGNCKQTFNAVLISEEDAKAKSERLSKRILHAQRQARAEALEKYKQKKEQRKQQEIFFESVSEEKYETSVSQISVDPMTVSLVGLDEVPKPELSPEPPEAKPEVEAKVEIEPKSEIEAKVEKIEQQKAESEQSDQELISKVDQLIEEKLTPNQAPVSKTEITIPNKPQRKKFSLDNKQAVSVKTRAKHGLLLLVTLLLGAVLLYQLWLRQATPFLERNKLPDSVSKAGDSLTKTLSESYGIELPIRSDLSKMHLVSARTQAHPTRASTTLLVVSLLNKSDIAQPYPWLELSLSDEDGRLVSRRALSPHDYRHNNRLSHLIQPKELRQVTIELLAFPKQAHGFELKLLNKQ